MVTTTTNAEWLETTMSRDGDYIEFTPSQARCVDVLASLGPLYNLVVPGRCLADAVRLHHRGFSILISSDLSTFDDDSLTRLVVAAHRHTVRVGVAPWRPHLDTNRAGAVRARIAADLAADGIDVDVDDVCVDALELTFHARTPGASHLFERHPGTADLAGTLTGL